MLKVLKKLAVEEDGISTVEIVVLIAILVGIALLFRQAITAYVEDIINNFTDNVPKPEDALKED